MEIGNYGTSTVSSVTQTQASQHITALKDKYRSDPKISQQLNDMRQSANSITASALRSYTITDYKNKLMGICLLEIKQTQATIKGIFERPKTFDNNFARGMLQVVEGQEKRSGIQFMYVNDKDVKLTNASRFLKDLNYEHSTSARNTYTKAL